MEAMGFLAKKRTQPASPQKRTTYPLPAKIFSSFGSSRARTWSTSAQELNIMGMS